MKRGKISDSILKRSVLKKIKINRNEVVKGAGSGEDCALFVPDAEESGSQMVALCTETIPFYTDEMITFGVYHIAGNMVASFAEPVALMVNPVLPEHTEETELRHIMEILQQTCDKMQMTIVGGHTELSAAVNEPVITLTGVGRRAIPAEREKQFAIRKREAGKEGTTNIAGELVMTGWVGLEGTVYLAKHGKDALLTRYPEKLIREATEFERYLHMLSTASGHVWDKVWLLHDVTRGGVFGALWELSLKAGTGLDVDLRKIPIRQETVEICEYFGVNPYTLLSGGCLMMVTEDGNELVEQLLEQGIPAVVVGYLTTGNDKIIRNGEEIRFLDRPGEDEIYRMRNLSQDHNC